MYRFPMYLKSKGMLLKDYNFHLVLNSAWTYKYFQTKLFIIIKGNILMFILLRMLATILLISPTF